MPLYKKIKKSRKTRIFLVTLVTPVTPIKNPFFRPRIPKEPIICVTGSVTSFFFLVTSYIILFTSKLPTGICVEANLACFFR